MNAITLAAEFLTVFFRVVTPSLVVTELKHEHSEEAAQLLSEEFCKREPLCKILGIKVADVLPVFRLQVAHVIEQNLSIVAVNKAGKVCAVITIEDHLALFSPNPEILTEELKIIGALLGTLVLPPALEPTGLGKLYYCGLVAIDSKQGKSLIILMFTVWVYRHLGAKGYQHGYAKVTNPGIGKKFDRLSRIFRREIFTRSDEVIPAAFVYGGKQPLKAFRGSIVLFSWPMAFGRKHSVI